MEHASATHTVFNQTPPLTDYNLYSTDMALQEAVRREAAPGAEQDLAQAGAELGLAASFEHARLANRYPPTLHGFNVNGDPAGARCSEPATLHSTRTPFWIALGRPKSLPARDYHFATHVVGRYAATPLSNCPMAELRSLRTRTIRFGGHRFCPNRRTRP